MDNQFEWVEFYKAFAEELLQYKDKITRRDIEKIDNQSMRVGWTTGQGAFRVNKVTLLNATLWRAD